MTRQTLPVRLFTTALLPCPYLPGRMERKLVAEIDRPDGEAVHATLARAGFRRSHRIAYIPACPGCAECVPVRVVAEAFTPSRSQRRLLRRNGDLIPAERPARATDEHYALFSRYQAARHNDGGMVDMGPQEYRAMVEDSPVSSRILEWRDSAGTLYAACLTDVTDDGLSGVYSFFRPEEARRSLGTFVVLGLISHARARGRPYVYLGYWIRDSRKMRYKTRFRPLEAFDGHAWERLPADLDPGVEGRGLTGDGV